jgi:hypothetical protein
MSLRVSNSVEKNVFVVPSAPVIVPDSQAKVVLPDTSSTNIEYAGRYIQNVGSNDCYYAFGTDNCSPGNFNGMLAKAASVNANGDGVGQQLDVSNCGQRVSVYSIGGTKIVVTVLKRNDLQQGQGNILVPLLQQ